MAQIVTTHDHIGKAVFSSKVPDTQKTLSIPLGQMTLLYSTHNFPLNVSTDEDIDQYLNDRDNGFGPGVACPPNGTSAFILQLAPGLKTPMGRQPTVGIFYVLEGEVTLHLDGGEAKTLKAGDAGALRGGRHSWSNDTPDGGWAKLLSFAQRISPIEISGTLIE